MNSDIKRIGTGARMSEGVCYNGIIWLAGQVGNPGESVADQTRTCLAEVDRILAEAGTDKTRILSTQIWLGGGRLEPGAEQASCQQIRMRLTTSSGGKSSAAKSRAGVTGMRSAFNANISPQSMPSVKPQAKKA